MTREEWSIWFNGFGVPQNGYELAEQVVADWQADITARESAADIVRESNRLACEENDRLQSHIEQLQDLLLDANAHESELQSQLDRLRKYCNDWIEKCAEVQDKLTKAQHKIAAIEPQLDAAQKREQELQAEIEHLNEIGIMNMQALEMANNSRADLVKEIDRLTKNYAELEDSIPKVCSHCGREVE